MKYKVFFIFLAAFLVRLIALNQSLWLDEAITAKVIHFGYLDILTKYSPYDFHPPLFYWLEKFWTNFFGYSEISLRMPSIIFSLLTGWVLYLIGGVWAASLFLFNPLIIYYSQEARMYMMATFFLTTALYFFISKTQNKYQKLNTALFLLSCSLAFFTFYGSIFMIAAFLLHLFYKKQYWYLLFSSIAMFVTFLVISPLLFKQLINSRVSLSLVKNWTLVLGKANIKDLLLILVKFSMGRLDFFPKWLYYSIAGSWSIFVIYQILKIKYSLARASQKYQSNIKDINLFYFFLIFPLILGFIFSFFSPLLQYFRFLYLIPIFSIILSFGATGKPENPPRRWIVLVGFIVFSLIYLLVPQFHREDWKNLVTKIPKKLPVYMITASADPFSYYAPAIKINDLRQLTDSRINKLPKELTVIPYTFDLYGLDYKKELKNKKYSMIDIKSVRGLYYEIWENN